MIKLDDKITLLNKDDTLIIRRLKHNLLFELKKNESLEFRINQSNIQVYFAFLKLYESIISGKLLPFESIDYYERSYYPNRGYTYEEYLDSMSKKINKLKDTIEYEYLVKDKKIIWKNSKVSDELDDKVSPSSLEINCDQDEIVLKFKNIEDDFWDSIIVCINSYDERYHDFYIPFETLYEDLRNIDLDDSQIRIEEYMYEEKLKRVRS